MFADGQDYIVVKNANKHNRNLQATTDYIISLEMAKHLAMTERTGKAFEVRQYFIESIENQTRRFTGLLKYTESRGINFITTLTDCNS